MEIIHIVTSNISKEWWVNFLDIVKYKNLTSFGGNEFQALQNANFLNDHSLYFEYLLLE